MSQTPPLLWEFRPAADNILSVVPRPFHGNLPKVLSDFLRPLGEKQNKMNGSNGALV